MPEASDLSPSRLHKHQQFGEHEVLVYLPPGYDSTQQRRFPVLYMQDGQNLFDPETSYMKGNYWHLGETADELVETRAIEPLIIVGIYNAGVRRIDEYTPAIDTRLGGGHADDYGRMIVEELKPSIDAQYRTDPQNSGMGGSSLGGLVSLYLGLRYPAIFSRLAVMSPSVWWRNREILKTVAALGHKPDLRIWLDIGSRESSTSVPDARALRDRLLKKGWQPGKDLAYMEAEGAEHTESAWSQRTGPMLRFLFPSR